MEWWSTHFPFLHLSPSLRGLIFHANLIQGSEKYSHPCGPPGERLASNISSPSSSPLSSLDINSIFVILHHSSFSLSFSYVPFSTAAFLSCNLIKQKLLSPLFQKNKQGLTLSSLKKNLMEKHHVYKDYNCWHAFWSVTCAFLLVAIQQVACSFTLLVANEDDQGCIYRKKFWLRPGSTGNLRTG